METDKKSQALISNTDRSDCWWVRLSLQSCMFQSVWGLDQQCVCVSVRGAVSAVLYLRLSVHLAPPT